MRKFSPKAHLNEFIFFQMVEEVRAQQRSRKDPELDMTEAQIVHDRLMSALEEATKNQLSVNLRVSADNGMVASRDLMIREINKAFGEFTQGTLATPEKYQAYQREFLSRYYPNWKSQDDPTMAKIPMGSEVFVSPYDDFYKDHHSLRSRDGAGMYVSSTDVASGLFQLQPYITQKDYANCSAHLAGIGRSDRTEYGSIGRMPEVIKLLHYMDDNGMEYSIEPDERGQLKASIDGTRINVRIMDLAKNDAYLGRVYDDGYIYSYTTTGNNSINYYTGADGTVRHTQTRYTNHNAEDMIRLLDFALGKETKQFDGKTNMGTDWLRRNPENNVRFSNNGNFSILVGRKNLWHGVENPDKQSDEKVIRRRDAMDVHLYVENIRSRSVTAFVTKDAAESFLRDAIHSARENFTEYVGIDRLIEEARQHRGEENYVPVFSGDPGIALIQQDYWNVLTNDSAILLRPWFTSDDYLEMSEGEMALLQTSKEKMTYSGTKEEQVRENFADRLDCLIGSYDLYANDNEPVDIFTGEKIPKRFDPANVAKFMSSAYGIYRNNDNIASALKTVEIPVDDLRGSDIFNKYLKDKMLKFNPSTAKPMQEMTSDFMQQMYRTIKSSLEQTGVRVDETRDAITIDDNGVVRYTGSYVRGVKDAKLKPIEGYLGQIFEPKEHGLVTTKFAGSDNYMFSPGYEAYIVPERGDEDKSMVERTKLRGYAQIMENNIRYAIRSDILAKHMVIDGVHQYGSTTNVNRVYRQLYDTRYPLDYFKIAKDQGMSDELRDAIFETNARRVRYSNRIKEGATINADYRYKILLEMGRSVVGEDDYASPFALTGHRNMSLLAEADDGYFDPTATGTGTNQGIVRFLTSSAQVAEDGSIIPGDQNDKCPLMKIDAMKYIDFLPFDRQQMVFSNLLQAQCVTEDVGFAQMTFGGWTYDDGYVVSKEFAEQNKVRGADGRMRDIMVGDKILDFAGNKGVISLIVDPDMNLDEAREQGLEEAVKWFRANDGLSVVGAPFPAVSRYSAAITRECLEDPFDLHNPDGRTHKGCFGNTKFIVTAQSVDKKSHVYGEEELIANKGRKVSSQLAWGLMSSEAYDVLNECYSQNNGPTENLREYLITCGLDLDETGKLGVGYNRQLSEERNIFKIPELEYKDRTIKGVTRRSVDVMAMSRKFSQVISQKGGFLELPFPLKFPTGDKLPEISKEKDDLGIEHTNYGLPIMSVHLRSGQEMVDNTSVVHDYTNNYENIYKCALQYLSATQEANEAERKRKMQSAMNSAQGYFDRITNDVISRKFEGKRNMFKEDLMSHRMARSATNVITADPRLNIDEIGMSGKQMSQLGLRSGDYMMVWRDPIIRDAGVRYMKVKQDDRLTGISMNPIMDKSFDADFDGDTMGNVVLQTKAAKVNAYEQLSVGSNLLDKGSFDGQKYKLMMQDGLDLKSAEAKNPELVTRRQELEDRVNELYAKKANGTIEKKEAFNEQRKLVKDLSGYVHDSLSHEYGTDMISFENMEEHLKSVQQYVDHGAKGSNSKMDVYLNYLGVSCPRDAEGHLQYDKLVDHQKPLITRDTHLDTEYATAVKAFGAGIAGMFSQRGMAAMREYAPTQVLEITYLVSQAVLQAKHDPVDARKKYEALNGSVRNLWRGYKLECGETNEGKVYWKTVKDDSGKPVPATKEEFVTQFMQVYGEKGLNVSVNKQYVQDLANIMTEKSTNKVVGVEETDKWCTTLDLLAYYPGFDKVVKCAKEGRNVFEGDMSHLFAPNCIKQNEQAKLNGGVVKNITKKDTSVDYESQTKKSKSVVINKSQSVQQSKLMDLTKRQLATVPSDEKTQTSDDYDY